MRYSQPLLHNHPFVYRLTVVFRAIRWSPDGCMLLQILTPNKCFKAVPMQSRAVAQMLSASNQKGGARKPQPPRRFKFARGAFRPERTAFASPAPACRDSPSKKDARPERKPLIPRLLCAKDVASLQDADPVDTGNPARCVPGWRIGSFQDQDGAPKHRGLTHFNHSLQSPCFFGE